LDNAVDLIFVRQSKDNLSGLQQKTKTVPFKTDLSYTEETGLDIEQGKAAVLMP
jgi:hypothetical protein